MHFKTTLEVNQEMKNDLLSLSSTGKNEAKSGFARLVQDSILGSGANEGKKMVSYSGYKKEGSNPDDDLEFKLLTGLADDIKVSIWKGTVESTVIKKTGKSGGGRKA